MKCFDHENCEFCRNAEAAEEELRSRRRSSGTGRGRRIPAGSRMRPNRRPFLFRPRPHWQFPWVFQPRALDVAIDADRPDDDEPDATDSGPSVDDSEFTVRNGVRSTLEWQEVLHVPTDLPKVPSRPGVYIVLHPSGKPIYVGESVNLRARWVDRLEGLDWLRPTIRVYFGVFLRTPSECVVGDKKRQYDSTCKQKLRAIEHAIVRVFNHGRDPRQMLRNKKPKVPFKVMDRDLTIVNVIPKDLLPYLAKPKSTPGLNGLTLTIKAGWMSPEFEAVRPDPWS